MCNENFPFPEPPWPERNYREWSEMKAEGIEIETMQEYVDEVRGLHDYPPEPEDEREDPDYWREEDEPDEPSTYLR